LVGFEPRRQGICREPPPFNFTGVRSNTAPLALPAGLSIGQSGWLFPSSDFNSFVEANRVDKRLIGVDNVSVDSEVLNFGRSVPACPLCAG
jgi:hypothetical protein